MRYILLATLFALSLSACKKKLPNYDISTFTGEEIPYESPTETAPNTKIFYAYSGTSLIATFSSLPKDTSDYKFYSTMYAGNIHDDNIGNFVKYTLRGGAIRWMRRDKKSNKDVEVGRITADTIVWYEPSKAEQGAAANP